MSKLPGGAFIGTLMLGSVPGMADPVADFDKDKQIRFVVRTPAEPETNVPHGQFGGAGRS